MRVALLLLLVFGSIESYNVELYNTADTAVTVQKMRNNVQTSVKLPAVKNGKPSNWNMTGLGAQDFVVFVMKNLVAQIEPSQTPNSIDLSVRYLYDTFNTTLNQQVYLPGQIPGAPYSYVYLCNELYVPQLCLATMGNPLPVPSNFLHMTLPSNIADAQPFKIYYNKPKGYSITLVNDIYVDGADIDVWFTRNGKQISIRLPVDDRWTVTEIMPDEQIIITLENMVASFMPTNPTHVPPQIQLSVSYPTGPGMYNSTIVMQMFQQGSNKPILLCNCCKVKGYRTCKNTNTGNEGSTQTAEYLFGVVDYEIRFGLPCYNTCMDLA